MLSNFQLKKALFLACLCFTPSILQAQNATNIEKIALLEKKLDVIFPDDYKQFMASIQQTPYQVFFRLDTWTFGDFETNEQKNKQMITKNILKPTDVVVAYNYDQVLFLSLGNNKQLKPTIFLADEIDRDIFMFYAFSISEIQNFPIVQRLKSQITPETFAILSLDSIKNCVGSLYNHAYNLHYYRKNEDDSEGSAAMRKKADSIYQKLAQKGHPWALTKEAAYYGASDNFSVDSLLILYRTAAQNGSYDEMKELADCIMDYKPILAQEAASILDFLLLKGYRTTSVLLKLSKLYKNPKYKMLDIKKSIEKLEMAIKLGDYIAKSNLAFYYYKGIGVKQDINIAYKLLKEANDADIQKWGGKGFWSEEVKKLEEEIKKR